MNASETTETVQKIYAAAVQLCTARWGTIAGFFGTSLLRPHHAFPLAFQPRDPYAPGFHPEAGKEYLAHTCVEVDIVQDDAIMVAESAVDAACHRLELQVRESMRGKPSIAPAILIDPGDRIQAIILNQSSGPIRVRITQLPGTSMIRIDLDLLIAKVTVDECISGSLNRLIPAVAQIVQTMQDTTSHRAIPLQVCSVANEVDGMPVAMILAMGENAVRITNYYGAEIVAKINAQDKDVPDDDSEEQDA